MSPRRRAKGKRPLSLERVSLEPVTWEVAVVPASEFLTLNPTGADAVVVLAVEIETGAVVCCEPNEHGDVDEAARTITSSMLRPPEGPPRRPRRMLVRDAQLAGVLESALPAGQQVELRSELPGIDALAATIATTIEQTAQAQGAYLARAGMAPDAVAGFFEAAAEFYGIAPWTLVDEPLTVNLPDRDAPLQAVIMGAERTTYGLVLFFDPGELATMFEGEDAVPFGADTIGTTFVPEAEVPPEMRNERRRHGWRIAGPTAYPMLLRTTTGGDLRPAGAEDMRIATLALRAVARFVRDNGDPLRQGRPCRATLDVEEPTAGRVRITVGFPADEGDDTDHEVLDLFSDANAASAASPALTLEGAGSSAFARATTLLHELVMRVSRSRQAGKVVRRLAWSFFRDSEPGYLEDDDARDDAVARFYEWAAFCAPVRTGGATLVRSAIDAATDLDDVGRRDRRALATPVFSMFEVVSVRRGQGYSLIDIADGGLYHVRDPDAAPGLRPKHYYVAALFPLGTDEHIAGGAAFSFKPDRKVDPRVFRGVEPSERPLVVEQILFGASTDWIDQLRPDQLPGVYDGFRADVAGAGIPAFSQVRRRIQSAQHPSDLLALASEVRWATTEEMRVFMAFVQRVWNITPRKELGGLSPEDAAARAEG